MSSCLKAERVRLEISGARGAKKLTRALRARVDAIIIAGRCRRLPAAVSVIGGQSFGQINDVSSARQTAGVNLGQIGEITIDSRERIVERISAK